MFKNLRFYFACSGDKLQKSPFCIYFEEDIDFWIVVYSNGHMGIGQKIFGEYFVDEYEVPVIPNPNSVIGG